MTYPETFEGFAVHDSKNWSTATKLEYTPRPFEDRDIDIKIEACGVCGSDVHTVRSGWGEVEYPQVVGHEIVGTVVRVGSKVTSLKVGDKAGVGAQCWACLECDTCKANNETYCPKMVDTYGDTYPNGHKTWGGYASHARAHEHFTFPIPKEIDSTAAAPMLCAGITTYSPLVRNGAGPGKKVGIVGVGGLGHFGIMWAHALGCETYVFSRTDKKKADALKMHADHFIATDKEDWNKDLIQKLDLIVCCANSASGFDLNSYLSTLKVGCKFVSVGLPEEPFNVSAMSFVANGSSLGSSHLGSRGEMLDMFKLAVDKKVETWVNKIDISEDGVKQGLERCHNNDCRYRITLTGFDKAFK